MHVEVKNSGSGNCYYLCYTADDMAGIIYNPDVRNHLTDFSEQLKVNELFDLVRPVVERLIENEPGGYEVKVFRFVDRPQRSLTEVELCATYGVWRTGDISYVNGVKQPLNFIAV